jgi:hypothetical protein
LAIVDAEGSKPALTAEDVNAMIPLIEAAERIPFSNLKVQSEAWVETKADLSDPCEPWQRTPIYVSSTAWFDGIPKGRSRMDVHKEVLKWQDGAAPYIESSYSVGFDGQYGRVVHHTTGHSGKTFPMKEGKLLSNVPEQLSGYSLSGCTGAYFSFQFFFNNDELKNKGRTFSRLFRAAASAAALEAKAFEVALEEFQGAMCIKFGSGEQKWGYENWWLDPARGFALLGHEHANILRDDREWLISRMKVSKLKEVSPGFWWPTEACIESGPLEPLTPYYSRTVYRASNVVANDPNFDESVFTVPFPEGYLIDDQVAGRKYIAGQE